MPSDDLSSIPRMGENHRRALATKLNITSGRALADADPDTIYTELRNLRPRPSRAGIAEWQRVARSRLSDADEYGSEWHTAASFAVIFAQRQVDGAWERRIQAQQTEVEPEPASVEWQGWNCEPLCDWMHDQLSPDKEEPEAGASGVTAAAAPTAGGAPGRTEGARLRIERVTITDAAFYELGLIADGKLTETPPGYLTSPVRLSLMVSGGRSGQQLQAAAWFLRQAEPGWSPQEPVTVSPSGEADLDLAPVLAGEHQIRLLAWATDARASLAGVTLPKLTFRQLAP